MPDTPERTVSRMVPAPTASRKASSLSPVPVSSITMVAGVTSMMRPRKMSVTRLSSLRAAPSARTLISIISRSMCGPSVSSISFTTSTSLLSCLTICSTMSSEPRVTMVMRDSDWSSVGATVSDSMLSPRAENRPATRDSAPDSFSSRIEMMCRMSGQLSFRREVHFVMALALSDHGIDVLGLIGDEVEEHQPVFQFQRFLQRGFDVGRFLDQHADVAVGFGELDEVRQRIHVRMRIAAVVEAFLPLPRHAHVAVVEVDDLDRLAVLAASRQFLDAFLVVG